jgi:hypothetical protein
VPENRREFVRQCVRDHYVEVDLAIELPYGTREKGPIEAKPLISNEPKYESQLRDVSNTIKYYEACGYVEQVPD